MGIISKIDKMSFKEENLYALRGRSIPGWVVLAFLVGAIYLLASYVVVGHAGFPLDDGWIHQTYARNFARTGMLSYFPGEPSAGSTSPLWSILLSVGYLLHVPLFAWTFGLGMAMLGLSAWTLARLSRALFPDAPPRVWVLTGLFCLVEWHMVWAALSGMETMLFIWLSLLFLERYLASAKPGAGGIGANFVVGFTGGLLVLTRPEGLGLLGLVMLAQAYRAQADDGASLRSSLRDWMGWAAGVMLPLTPYVAFHVSTTGHFFPNTLYAKQREYGLLLETVPLWARWLRAAGIGLVGAQGLLLPGIVAAAWRTVGLVGKKRPGILIPWAWIAGYVTVYALRLPVTYQHGRYQMPVIPFLLLLGIWGTSLLLRPRSGAFLPRVLSRAALASLALLLPAFLLLGAKAYAEDVGFIEGEMMDVTAWLRENTSPGDLLAVHDIGVVGYFLNDRPLLDLAGLITPEVIPFIDDEEQLLEFMEEKGATYAVFFPDWSEPYARMARDPRLVPVYSTGYEWTLQQGAANMAVYRYRANR